MSSRPNKPPRSIATQLVWLFTLAAALLLSCGLGVLYLIVVRHAFQEDNEFLNDKLSALHADLKKDDWRTAIHEELERFRADEHGVYWVRIIDSRGHTVAETPDMDTLLPANIFPSAQKPDSGVPRAFDHRTRDKLFSTIAAVTEAGNQPVTIQIAQDRSADDRFAKNFAALLAAVLAGGIVASAVIALTVTRHGLRPLAEMARSFRRVGPTRLNERVFPAEWPRELQPLAVAFDDMLDRLQDSFTRLSQFSADLAHELRTPIANILGESQVALTRARTPDEYREVIESNVAECERLSGIIDNLLFLARAEAADGYIQRSVFDGKAAIAKIAAFYEPIAEEQQVTISCEGEGEVYADPVLFGRAVNNLVENALHHTPAGGSILISIKPGKIQSQISVKDTGCGIAAEHVPHVFDRFYRVDSSRSSGGSGLGLALVKSIVDLHRGSTNLTSVVNSGTTITLTFPNKID